MHRTGLINLTITGLAALSACVAASRPEVFAREEATMVSQEAKIAGGTIAGVSDFPFIAFVHGQVSDTEGSSCTGSLIGPNVVLTAGHCVYTEAGAMYLTTQMSIAFTHTRPTSLSDFNGPAVKEIIVNPDFNRATLSNDIALIILESNVPSSLATPAKIYTGSVNTSTSLIAAGFGITNPTDSSSVPTDLMEVNLVSGTTAYCQSIWSSFNPAKLICTNGAGGKDTCSGDSGGPLATPINNSGGLAIAGITSFAPVTSNNPDGLCAVAGSTGYYVHVNYYIDWIANAANLDASSIGVSSTSGSSSSLSSDSDSDDNGLDSIINLETASNESDFDSESGSAGAASALVADKKTLSSAVLGLAAIGLAVLF
ncbi:hypothetical protein LPJ59_000031 [Coemansia sp. RSA 2399]|nr:hypothetical protein LPJ59_000031 [Coemansia sp. RSA 2399]KAJ1908530.1 hypothetical protein LPJ81_000031 [Coemansia sp. IMI 209127]